MRKPEHYQRLNSDLSPDDKGRFFIDAKEPAFCDLSSVNILRCGVDTVRQLYRGVLKPGILTLFDKEFAFLGGYEWATGRISRDSGYQYRLQNADLGLILLVKNFNVKIDSPGPHLKVEVSPHLIDEKSPKQLQAMIDALAHELLDTVDYNQAAVHLAIDLQGWEPPADIVARMHCRSRAVRQFDGVDTVDFAGLSCTYGRGETYMFGSASGLQLCIYNKTLQAKATDKLDFWESVWRSQGNPFDDEDPANYDSEKPVWRVEFRFHHSVVQQFSEGSTIGGEAVCFQNFAELAPHLDGLLRYGFDAFKLLHRPGYYAPIWTLLAQDVRVQCGVDSFLDDTDYQRYYKTSSGFSGKNIELLLGNAISLAARERLTAEQTVDALKTLPFWATIAKFYDDKGMDEPALIEHIAKLLKERYLRWGRAV